MSAPATVNRPLGELLDRRARWMLLISLMTAMFVSALNQALVSTATPQILADLGGFDLLSWVFTVYMLSSTIVVPIVGKLSDIFGRRLFLLSGIAVFMVGSALSGASQSMPELIAARALQGFGGGAIFACVFAVLGDLFPPAERGKYIGLFTGTFTLASLIGPTVGGILTDTVGWRWCFFLNVPVGAVALGFIWTNLPAHIRTAPRPRIDFLGAALLSGTTIALLLGLAWSQEEYGWTAATTIGLFVAAGALLVAFILQERHHPEAIFPPHVFRNREFVLCNITVFLLGAAGFGAIQYLPTFVQTALGASATASGLVTTPQSIALLVSSIIGGQLLARTGRYRKMLIGGGILILTATILLSTLTANTSPWAIAVYMAIYGLGFGFVMPLMSVIIQNAVSHQYMGVATSARQFFMQIGNVLGAAVFGVVLASAYTSAFDSNVSDEAKATIPPETLALFEDPTLALDEARFAGVSEEVLALPGGEALLTEVTEAQADSVATAMRYIFIGASAIAAVAFILIISLREVPLRRAFQTPERPHGDTPERAAPAAAAPLERSPEPPGPTRSAP